MITIANTPSENASSRFFGTGWQARTLGRAARPPGYAPNMAFTGWPAAAFEFYVGLEADNSRDYWQAHRAVYDASVKAPFLALSELIEKEFGPLRLFRPTATRGSRRTRVRTRRVRRH